MKKILYLLATIIFAIAMYSIIKKTMHRPIKEVQVHTKLESIQKTLEEIFKTKADFFPDEGVIKINVPRNDIKVSIADWHVDPFMGLTSWIGFQKGTKENIEIMAMGDLVLLENEVNPALSTALAHKIQITALHNHFFYDNPKVYFMHIEAEGATESLANGIHAIFETIKNSKAPMKMPLPSINAINGDAIEKIIGVKGNIKEGMFKIVLGRKIQAGCGCMIGKNMGINTWAAFAGTDDNALVDGDFAMLEEELQDVLKVLRDSNINIVAIHNHMINERPRMMFLHFWGQGKTVDLAQAIKNAVDKTSTLKSSDVHKSTHIKLCCNEKK